MEPMSRQSTTLAGEAAQTSKNVHPYVNRWWYVRDVVVVVMVLRQLGQAPSKARLLQRDVDSEYRGDGDGIVMVRKPFSTIAWNEGILEAWGPDVTYPN
ncbi:hypothetical protein Tco_0578697 [Tanacetum coccineum]